MTRISFAITVIFLTQFLAAQEPETGEHAEMILPPVTLSEAEMEVFNLINDYREDLRLPPITLSLSLTYVAQAHVCDLAENNPTNDTCNLHSWSSKGNWNPCCYTDDHKYAGCMWKKPAELTGYKGNGYEIAFWTNNNYSDPTGISLEALNAWKKSTGHNEMIINKGIWEKVTWKALGVGIYKGYVVAWFGEEEDN
jgi:uncharacterized protein YkwD